MLLGWLLLLGRLQIRLGLFGLILLMLFMWWVCGGHGSHGSLHRSCATFLSSRDLALFELLQC